MMKLRTLCFFISSVAFMHLSSAASAQHMVDSSEYVSIVEKIQQRGHMSEGIVRINQSSTIGNMLRQNALTNQQSQTLEGYRIRIYRDNNQHARTRSEQIMEKFKEQYPDIGIYRSYSNPYFMVTIGDFRTADDATKFQNQLVAEYGKEYSNTYVVKEKIYFPPIRKNE